ncbi:hypothetical protein VRRI112168_02830 [Vreelandella rituensis]|uniref:Uncharacterized protein n=1 Tax=Vreelandella rituensis TaxID=2282306 RepID=A0A368U904_9GAMM|nr:hypothetical protein [Halomonas rituensis]RCV93679.1 hypothetical protein DU506_00550 [Halomonas rituensis]
MKNISLAQQYPDASNELIELHCFGIKIQNNAITSDLHEAHLPDASEAYEAAMDAIESLVLAHHCAGIDVTDPAYLEGIETAVESLANNID